MSLDGNKNDNYGDSHHCSDSGTSHVDSFDTHCKCKGTNTNHHAYYHPDKSKRRINTDNHYFYCYSVCKWWWSGTAIRKLPATAYTNSPPSPTDMYHK